MTEIRQCIEQLADLRRNRNTQYRFSDVAMTAFLVFFTRSPLFLSRQRQMSQDNDGDNCATPLFGMACIPCDNQILQSLDRISPALFYGALGAALAMLRQKPGRRTFAGFLQDLLTGTKQYKLSTDTAIQWCSVNQCAKTTKPGKSVAKPENFHLQYELQSNTKTRNKPWIQFLKTTMTI